MIETGRLSPDWSGGPAASAPRLCRFMGLQIEVGPDVLVPRPETELLGRAALARRGDLGPAPVIVDMGCGSGNLALALADAIASATVWACDLTDGAVAAARRNVARLALSDRVRVAQGDLFASLAGRGLEGRVDLVVCNPPYISSARLGQDRAVLLRGEPREAFDGGPYGLSIHQRLVTESRAYLKPGGWLAFEFGEGQARQALALIARTRAYEQVELVCDDRGEVRVAVARLSAPA